MKRPQVSDDEIAQLVASHLNGRYWFDGRRHWFRDDAGKWVIGTWHVYSYIENVVRHFFPADDYWARGRHRIRIQAYYSTYLSIARIYMQRPADLPEHPTRPGWR